MRKNLFRLIALMLFAGLGAVWIFGSVMTSRSAVPPSPLPEGALAVKIRTSDGIILSGNFWPGKNDRAPAILAMHGIGSSRQDFDGDGEEYSSKGYAFLAINLRAHGDSSGDTRGMGYFEGRDAHAALSWLKTRQHGAKVAVLGSSLGGAAALLGDEGPLTADAFVLSVVYPDIRHAIRNWIKVMARPWPSGTASLLGEPLISYQALPRFGVWPDALSPRERIHQLHVPVFVIGGERDTYTPPVETRSIYASANAPKQI